MEVVTHVINIISMIFQAYSSILNVLNHEEINIFLPSLIIRHFVFIVIDLNASTNLAIIHFNQSRFWS